MSDMHLNADLTPSAVVVECTLFAASQAQG